MGCASGYSCFLLTTMALAGLALVGTAGYLLVIGHQPFVDSTAHYGWTAWIPLVFGLFVIVLAACACCCNSVGWSVCCIFLLALLLLLFGAVVIASGSILVVLSEEYLPTISSAASATEGVPHGFIGLQQETSDFLLGLYSGCCRGAFLSRCPNVTASDAGAHEYCYKNLYSYDTGLVYGGTSLQRYCALGNLPATCPSSSGQLLINAFLEENARLIHQAVLPFGIALAVLGVLLLLTLVASATVPYRSCEGKRKPVPSQQHAAGEAPDGPKALEERSCDQIQYT